MSRSFTAASFQYGLNTGGSPVSTYPFTFSCWFNPATAHAGGLMSCANGTSNNAHMLYLKSNSHLSMFSINGGTSAESESTATYSTSAWNHAAGVVASATSRTSYLNGTASTTNTTSVTPGTLTRACIGAYYTNGAPVAGFYQNGLLAEVGYWDVALTQEEITSLSQGVSPLLIRPANLVGYYPLFARASPEEAFVGALPFTLTNAPPAGSSHPRILRPLGATGSAGPAGGSNGITLVTPEAGRIHQRSGTTGTVTITGTYTGSPTSIEARLVQDGTNTPVSGFDWTTKDASPTGGAYSFSFTSVPQGGWYNVQVRFGNDTPTSATSGKVGVGALYAINGQSSAYLWFRSRSTATTPNALTRTYGNVGTWTLPDNSAMSGAIGFGNAMATALSIPIGVLDYSVDGSSLSGDWLPVTDPSNRAFTNAIAALDGKIEAAVWIQGESDAGLGRTQAQYYADMGTLFADWRSQFSQSGLPIIVVPLGKRTDAAYSDAAAQAIIDAHIQKTGDTAIYRVDRRDIPLHADGIHHSAAGYETLGARVAQSALHILGSVAYSRGPAIASVTTRSTTVYDVNLTHRGGTDFTPTSGITGFRVLVSGSPVTISTVAQQSASVIRVTLSSAAGATPVFQYLYGINPTVTGAVVDNSALALPLESTDSTGVTATTSAGIAATDGADVTAIATTVTTGAAIAAADGADVTAITAANWTNASLALSDGADVTAIIASTGTTTNAGIAASDGADVPAVVAAVQTGRPIADITTGSWAASGGGALWPMLDEVTQDDADYVYLASPTAGDYFEVKLPPLIGPGATHVFSMGLEAVGLDTDFDFDLMEGATVRDSWTESVTVAASPVTRTYTISAPVLATITDRTNVRIRVAAHG